MEEQKVKLGNSAAIIGFDESEGTQEFLNRTKYKSKIDQVIEFYGIPYGYKNDIKQFLKYHIQERHRPIVHAHFYSVFKGMGYDTNDLNYGDMQQKFDEANKDSSAGLDLKVNYDLFKEQEISKRAEFNGQGIGQFADFMTGMLKELKEIKQSQQDFQTKFLNLNNKSNEGHDTNGESQMGETTEEVKGTEDDGGSDKEGGGDDTFIIPTATIEGGDDKSGDIDGGDGGTDSIEEELDRIAEGG